MAISNPTNAVQNKSKNQAAENAKDKDIYGVAEDRDILYDTLRNDINWHKSFDFSDVGVQDDNFRKFHQMRLYINTGRLYHHSNGKTLNTVSQTAVITSNLPERISYSIGSEWEAPLSSFQNGMANLIMQLANSDAIQSGASRATTFKVWTKTKPLSLELKIPVIDDIDNGGVRGDGRNTNMVEALEYLASLALPSLGANGFYSPPPSPMKLNVLFSRFKNSEEEGKRNAVSGGKKSNVKKLNTGTDSYDNYQYTMSTTHGRIMLQLGGILLVDNCIIEGISVNYPNTKAMIRHSYNNEPNTWGYTGKEYLHPLLAEVTLKISTIEALTIENYSKMIWNKSQPSAGTLKADFTGYGTAFGTAIVDKVTNLVTPTP